MRLRILLPLICLTAICHLTASAQKKLNTDEFFTMKFQDKEGVTAVEIQGNVFAEWGNMITLFKSLKVSNPKDIERIEKAVKQDVANATARTSSMTNGRLLYIWYALPPVQKDINRYIIYVHRPDNAATLIYMEGKLVPQQFKKYILEKYAPVQDLTSELIY